MSKKTLLAVLFGLLTACSSTPPNLLKTDSPQLNIEADLAPQLEVNLHRDSVQFKNRTGQPLTFRYHLFWYDNQGVTQVWQDQQESLSRTVTLTPQQELTQPLPLPSAQSAVYRLYIGK